MKMKNSKAYFAGMMFYLLTTNPTVRYSQNYAYMDALSKAAFAKQLQKKGYIFGAKSTLDGQPTRKGFKLLAAFKYSIPKYRKQIEAVKAGEKIAMSSEDGVYYI